MNIIDEKTEKLFKIKEVDKKEVDKIVVRFSGDSGDGMQLTGMQFTDTAALFGNDLSTFPDYPWKFRNIYPG